MQRRLSGSIRWFTGEAAVLAKTQDSDAPVLDAKRAGKAPADPYKVVCVRLRAAEFEQFSDDVEAMGLTGSMALRIAARRVSGFLEVDGETRRELEDILRAIGSVTVAVRDLHAAYLATGDPGFAQLEAQRYAFGQEFTRLDGALRVILNVSLRRSDGMQRFVAAAG